MLRTAYTGSYLLKPPRVDGGESRYEILRQAFEERVLPYFPQAIGRFRKHFRASYRVMRHFKSEEPKDWDNTKAWNGRAPEAYLSMDLVYALFGLKPLSFLEDQFLIFCNPRLCRLLRRAGLRSHIHTNDIRTNRFYPLAGTLVYDPKLASAVLSRKLGHPIASAVELSDLVENEDNWSNELMGYPQPLDEEFPFRPGMSFSFSLSAYSFGYAHGHKYHSSTDCGIQHPSSVVPLLFGCAAAAALAEDIRDVPASINSKASICCDLHRDGACLSNEMASVVIRRSGYPGLWFVEAYDGTRLYMNGMKKLLARHSGS